MDIPSLPIRNEGANMSNTIFKTVNYINKRMKACHVPHNALSCDTPARVLHMAERALEQDWITHKRTEELYFEHIGNVWVSYLKYKNG